MALKGIPTDKGYLVSRTHSQRKSASGCAFCHECSSPHLYRVFSFTSFKSCSEETLSDRPPWRVLFKIATLSHHSITFCILYLFLGINSLTLYHVSTCFVDYYLSLFPKCNLHEISEFAFFLLLSQHLEQCLTQRTSSINNYGMN